MSETEQVARRYFDAWTSGDNDTAGAFPSDATTAMVAEAYQGEVGFQMHDATRGERTVRVVEQLT